MLFKALLDNNTYTQYVDYVTFRALSPIFVKSISLFYTHDNHLYIYLPLLLPIGKVWAIPCYRYTLPNNDKKYLMSNMLVEITGISCHHIVSGEWYRLIDVSKLIYTQLQKKPISHFSGQLWKTELRNEIIFIPYSLTISSASIH